MKYLYKIMLEIFNDVPNIMCLTLKNSKTTPEKFQHWKKNQIGIRIFLVNYLNNSIDYFFNYYWKFSSPMYWKITIFLQCTFNWYIFEIFQKFYFFTFYTFLSMSVNFQGNLIFLLRKINNIKNSTLLKILLF